MFRINGNYPTFLLNGEPVSVSVKYGLPPVKGDLIAIKSEVYRVLKISGNIAEVLAMSNAAVQKPFGTDHTYAGSNLDTYLNTTWYATLPTTIKNSIVSKTFKQDSWYYGSNGDPVYNGNQGTNKIGYTVSLDSEAYGTSITRNVYALSVKDIIDYLGVTASMTATDTSFTMENVRKMFWLESSSSSNDYIWLRSADPNTISGSRAFCVSYSSGDLWSLRANESLGMIIRPAFQIDLSKVPWTKTSEVT